MTLALAGAAWRNDQRTVLVAADSRLSLAPGLHMDAGIKTYDLGGACAMVASGHALPPVMAADLTRSIVESHNRSGREPPLSFFTTMKLFSFFARRAAREQQATSHVAAVGFLEQGEPCIATVIVSPELNRTNFMKLNPGDVTAIPIGDPNAARLVLHAMATAKRSGRPVFAAAVSMLYYICKNAGAFHSVGGALSVGTCAAPATHFSWPIIEIDGLRFLRGMDVTGAQGPRSPPPEVVPYDEPWCATLDAELASAATGDPTDGPSRGTLPGYDIDVAVGLENLFATVIEPDLSIARP